MRGVACADRPGQSSGLRGCFETTGQTTVSEPAPLPPNTDSDSGAPLPWRRLVLPGPRWLWWLLCTTVLSVALVLAAFGRVEDQDRAATIRFEMRIWDLGWRVTQWLQPQASTKPQRGRANVPTVLSEAQIKPMLVALFSEAAALDRRRHALPSAPPQPRLADEVVAHCVAMEFDQTAAALAVQLPTWSTEVAAALAALPADVTVALGTTADRLPPATAAAATTRAAGFARNWSDWVRDRLRVRTALRAGVPTAPGVVAGLVGSDRTISATVMTLAYVAMLAALWGVAWWLMLGLRRAMAMRNGQPPWEWLRRRYPGLPDDNPYFRDAIVPLLALTLWLAAQLATAPLALLGGSGGGSSAFSVLLQTMVGLAAVQSAVTWLSPTRVPLIHAARLGGDPAVPLGMASTAALRVLASLLPVMFIVSIFASALGGGGDRIHDVFALGMGRGDPVTLAVLGLAAAVVGPLSEELLFRGLIYRQVRQRGGPVVALFVSSALFAVMHMSPAQVPQYFVLGAAFALAYEWVGSLWASVILHCLWNLGAFVVMVCVVRS